MGPHLSRSRLELNNGQFIRNKKSFRISKRSNLKYEESSELFGEPAYSSIPLRSSSPLCPSAATRCDMLASSMTSLTYVNEKSEKCDSVPQRTLPSIPDKAKERDTGETGTSSVPGQRSSEAAPHLAQIAELARHILSKCDAPDLCPQSSSGRIDEKEIEALVNEKEDPSRKSCQREGLVNSYEDPKTIVGPSLKTNGHSAVVQMPPDQPNKLDATAPEDNYTSVNLITTQSTDETYMRIDSPAMTDNVHSIELLHHVSQTDKFIESSETSENACGAASALENNIENEETFLNDYVRTDFNHNADVLARANPYASTRQPPVPISQLLAPPSHVLLQPKTQAIVGPTSGPRLHGGVALFPVPPGTKRMLSGATVEVPITAAQGPSQGCVEIGWSNNSREFPALASGQRPLTKVLHCLPQGSTFTSPVVISVDLSLTEGQIEIFYSPTDVGQTPVWRKLRAIDAPANTCFTDDNLLFRNSVTLDRDRRIARFELRHFCAFFVVENGRVIEAKKTRAKVLLKTEFGHDFCSVVVRVVCGCLEDCAQQKMMEKLRSYRLGGFRVLDDVEFDLFASELKSVISVKISQAQWVPVGDITHGNLDAEEFALHQLWNDGTVGAMFWQRSRMTNKVRPTAFAAIVHIQQDDRQEMRTKLYCNLESPLAIGGQQDLPCNDYTLIQHGDQCATEFPSCIPSGIPGAAALPNASSSSTSTSTSSSSKCKNEWMDLHSTGSEPEIKVDPTKTLDRQHKEIEAGPAIKAANTRQCSLDRWIE